MADPVGLLRAIFAGASVGLQIFARDGHCVLANRAHRELFGAETPPGYNLFEDTVLAERGVSDLVRRAFAGETVRIAPIWYDPRELRNVRVDEGRRVAIGSEIVPLRGERGEVEHVLIVFHDVTGALEAREQAERSRAEAEASAARHAFLAEAGRVLASSLDYEATLARTARLATPALADFCIVDILDDDGTYKRVAASHADPAGQPVLDELCLRFPPTPGSPQPAARVIASRRAELLDDVDPAVVARYTRSPEHHALMLRLGVRSHLAVPLVLGERTLGAISLGYVGERRYGPADVPLAEALASRAAVAIDNARLYREAERSRSLAEAASRTKDEFLAMLGHELRNPLSPIVTALDLLRVREGPSREREVIERQVTHLTRLVDDLLDVSRITRGKVELDRRPFDLRLAVNDAVELATPLLAQRRHATTVRVEPGLVVNGDRVRIAQVVANLLTNAARYTEPGGSVTVTGERAGAAVVLRVRDTGAGIPAELLPRVFEVFVQGTRSIDRSAGGLGLGLTIVKALVELHGGTVAARSEGVGAGSEFEVTLPAADGDDARAAESDTSPTIPPRVAGRGRVLIVDDNVDAGELLGEMVAGFGYTTRVAHDPPAAIEVARDFRPDLALLDIGLPMMDGYELAGRLREALPTLRLVAVTGYGQRGDRDRAREAGFDAHLVKPVSIDDVYQTLGRLLPWA